MMDHYHEYIGAIHIHSTYSDGTAPPEEIARIANQVGLDFCILTDHAAFHPEYEGRYGKTLLLVGEEIHNPDRKPYLNHYLAFGIRQDLAHLGSHAQTLINAVRDQGGCGYIAHPCERTTTLFGESELPWLDWDVDGYAGLEVWNYTSEIKSLVTGLMAVLLMAYFPRAVVRGPFPETLWKWDEQLRAGKRVGALAGVDAHAKTYQLGLLRRQVFSYAHLFRSARTHILTTEPLNGEMDHDRGLILEALGRGRCWAAYDGLADTTGFRFIARTRQQEATMGDEVGLESEAVLEVHVPRPAHLRLKRDGFLVAETRGQSLRYLASAPGAYRVEAYRRFLFVPRGWVFSSPIYLRRSL